MLSPADAAAPTLLRVPLRSQFLHGLNLPLGLSAAGFNKRAIPTAPTHNAIVKVVASVNCGNAQVFNNVLVDTGSAVLWVGGDQQVYVPGPHTENIKETFSIGYGIGGVNGTAFLDTVTIGEATANRAVIGSAAHMSGFNLVKPIDGILGLGPSGSNTGEVGSNGSSTPTFVESLVASKAISELVFGVYISPLSTEGMPEGTGDITFGGVDESRIKGDVTWVPQTGPANFHWEFTTSTFSFGPNVTLSTSTFTRTDTGVLPISIPFDQFFDMLHAYNGSISFDHSALSSFLTFPSSIAPLLPDMTFTIDQFTVSIPPSQYIVPPSLYPGLKVTADASVVRTWIGSGGDQGFVLGQKWLESVYTAYDMNKHQIGFAHLA